MKVLENFRNYLDGQESETKNSSNTVPLNTQNRRVIDDYPALHLHAINLALYAGINIIANAISKCEFKIYIDKKEHRGEEWYLFNCEPNRNQNSNEFISKLITKLYTTNECLVLNYAGELLIADSYTIDSYGLTSNKYDNVTVNGYAFSYPFYEKDVFFYRLNSVKMHGFIAKMNEIQSKILDKATKNYLSSNSRKMEMKVDTTSLSNVDEEFQTTYNQLLEEDFKAFMGDSNAVIPIFNGFELNDLSQASTTSRDIKAIYDDVADYVGQAIGVRPSLLKGDVQDTSQAVEELLTFTVDALVDLIQTENNRKLYGKRNVLKGTYLKIDTTAIKHIDILSVASDIDKLISSGCMTINMILKRVGMQELDEEWANQHFITKNYATIEEVLEVVQET